MANQGLRDVARSYRPQMGGVQPISMGEQAQPMMGEGVSTTIDPTRLKKQAMASGYVAGYVMCNAPAISMGLSTTTPKGQTTPEVNIVCRESKPTRMLAVLMAIPANCITRNGGIATPADIRAGAIDWGTANPDELIYMAHTKNTAVGYIQALGGMLPEYAPFVTDGPNARKQQWSAEEILSGAPSVTFVRIRATEKRAKDINNGVRFNFSLKSTSPRKSLFTEKNICCLRALEHVKVKINSEKDAYEMNNIAFGSWQYRKLPKVSEYALQRAMNAAPTQIWAKKYEIDGKTVEGIGSCYFVYGNSAQTESGENLKIAELSYLPWYTTGKKKDAMPKIATQIVKRTFQAAESGKGGKKDNYVTTAVTLRDNPNHAMFQPYTNFVNFIEKMGFLSHDELLNLASRSTSSKRKSMELTEGQLSSLDSLLKTEAVAAELAHVRDAAVSRMTLRARA